MKKVTNINFLFFIISISFFLIGCKNQIAKSEKTKNNVKSYSKYLEIDSTDTGIKIKIKHPERINKSFNYFIAKKPKVKAPPGYINLDVKSMNFIVFSTTHIGMLAELNQLHRIKGTCSKELIYNQEVLKKITSGDIKDFGQESNPSIEKIIAINPKAIIYSGLSSEFTKSKELERLGINTIPNFDWKEAHPLGKAEWILLFGYLTGTEKEARQHMNKIKQEYFELKNIAAKARTKPIVLAGTKMGDFWYGPAGESFGAQLLKDANSNYLYQNTTGYGSVEFSLEKVLQDSKDAEIWINPGAPTYEKLVLQNPKAVHLTTFKNKNVFCYNHNPNKYWELSGMHPEWVLADLIEIFHPDLLSERSLIFYRKLD